MAKKESPADVASTRVRLLVDSDLGKCNQVVDVDPAIVAEGVKAGIMDDSAEAVAYAESLPE